MKVASATSPSIYQSHTPPHASLTLLHDAAGHAIDWAHESENGTIDTSRAAHVLDHARPVLRHGVLSMRARYSLQARERERVESLGVKARHQADRQVGSHGPDAEIWVVHDQGYSGWAEARNQGAVALEIK